MEGFETNGFLLASHICLCLILYVVGFRFNREQKQEAAVWCATLLVLCVVALAMHLGHFIQVCIIGEGYELFA